MSTLFVRDDQLRRCKHDQHLEVHRIHCKIQFYDLRFLCVYTASQAVSNPYAFGVIFHPSQCILRNSIQASWARCSLNANSGCASRYFESSRSASTVLYSISFPPSCFFTLIGGSRDASDCQCLVTRSRQNYEIFRPTFRLTAILRRHSFNFNETTIDRSAKFSFLHMAEPRQQPFVRKSRSPYLNHHFRKYNSLEKEKRVLHGPRIGVAADNIEKNTY